MSEKNSYLAADLHVGFHQAFVKNPWLYMLDRICSFRNAQFNLGQCQEAERISSACHRDSFLLQILQKWLDSIMPWK